MACIRACDREAEFRTVLHGAVVDTCQGETVLAMHALHKLDFKARDNAHPLSPPFPVDMNRPVQFLGNHISISTLETGDVVNVNSIRQISVWGVVEAEPQAVTPGPESWILFPAP